jgi:hypothetical protein
MSFLPLKITVIVIILFPVIGFVGCMTPQYAPPVNRQQQVRTKQIQPRPVSPQYYRQPSYPQPSYSQPFYTQPPNRQTVQTNRPATQNLTSTYPAPAWYDPLGILGVPTRLPASAAASTSSQKKQLQKNSVNSTNPNSNSVQSKPIAQVAYQTSTQEKKTPVQKSPMINPVSKVSPELLQPWSSEHFKTKRTVSNSHYYQLVADIQESDSVRTSPPPMDVDRFIALPQQKPAQSSSSWSEKVPILNLGLDLLHELRPSNNRKWSQNHAVLQTATFNENRVTVHNVRYSKYETEDRYTTQYYDAAFNLDEIQTIDMIVVPFRGAPRLAHVESSFGFADGRHLAMSIEARYEEGEKYDPLGAGLRQFELIYVFADERDMIRLGTDVHKNDVHIYRLKFEPNEVREMFVDALRRANKLAEKPEFYHPLTNSCVTNLIAHINKGRPKAVPKEYRTLLPGLMDHYVYDLKLVDTTAQSFQDAKENAKVNWLVEKYGDLEYFSAGIRQNMY